MSLLHPIATSLNNNIDGLQFWNCSLNMGLSSVIIIDCALAQDISWWLSQTTSLGLCVHGLQDFASRQCATILWYYMFQVFHSIISWVTNLPNTALFPERENQKYLLLGEICSKKMDVEFRNHTRNFPYCNFRNRKQFCKMMFELNWVTHPQVVGAAHQHQSAGFHRTRWCRQLCLFVVGVGFKLWLLTVSQAHFRQWVRTLYVCSQVYPLVN